MSGWQPEYQPRRAAGRAPAVPPQFEQQPRLPWRYDPPQPQFDPWASSAQPPAPAPQQYGRPPPAARRPVTQPRPPRMPVAPRRLPPYPAHLVRFPAVLPRSRRRGHSVGHYVYLGTHPVALLLTLCIDAMIICAVVGWLALVWGVWMMWAMIITMVWLGQLAVAALRR